MSVTYYVALPFLEAEGDLVAGEAREAPSSQAAVRRAQAMATTPPNVGAVAFARTGDPATGEFEEGVELARFGRIDVQALGQ